MAVDVANARADSDRFFPTPYHAAPINWKNDNWGWVVAEATPMVGPFLIGATFLNIIDRSGSADSTQQEKVHFNLECQREWKALRLNCILEIILGIAIIAFATQYPAQFPNAMQAYAGSGALIFIGLVGIAGSTYAINKMRERLEDDLREAQPAPLQQVANN